MMKQPDVAKPIVTLFEVENPLADRLVRSGLSKSKLDEKEPDETFVFPLQLRGRQSLDKERATEMTIAMQVIDVIRRTQSVSDVTPEMVANWLSDQAQHMERDLWIKTAQCVRRLVFWHLPNNIGAWDLRRLASLVDVPEAFYERSRRFQKEYDFLLTMRLNEESLLKLYGIDGEMCDAMMYNVDTAMMED